MSTLYPGTAVDMPVDPTQGMPLEDDTRFMPPILLEYWHTMLRWRKVLLGIIGASLILSLLVTFLMAPAYTAKAEIEISRHQKKFININSLDAQEEPQDLEFYATQYKLLNARSLADRIAKTLRLADDPAFYAAHGKKTPVTDIERSRAVVKILLGSVGIEPIRGSRLVDVTYTGRSPELSARIANAWIREFIGATTDREYESSAQARTFLESRLDALRVKMKIADESAVNYASRNNIIVLESRRDTEGKTQIGKTLAAADLEQLETALLVARADRIAAQARAQKGHVDASLDILNNQSIGLIKQKRAEIAGEYAKLLSQFEPAYPTARGLKQELDELDAAIARDTDRFNSERKQTYEQARAREAELEGQVAATKAQLDKQNHASIQYNIYQRDADTNQQLYDGLLQRYKEIAEAGSVGASNIAVVDEAQVPYLPSSPNLALNMAIALLVGIGVAAIAVIALEQTNEGIRSPTDVGNLLKLPLLGNVPLTKEDLREALLNPKSSLNEAYHSIRSNLAFSTNHGLPRSLAFTSSQPMEGKSTSALALAEIIGRTGKSVVLVDSDMRSPSVHTFTAIVNESGLSNLLTGDDDISAHVRTTDHRGLYVVTAGPLPPNPAELLGSDVFGQIIARLLEIYDHVIVDAPPVLGLADAPLICRSVEGCVFIAEPGRAPLRTIRAALQRLKFVGARVFGVVITKIDINSQHYGYTYGYGYGYGFDYSHDTKQDGTA